MATKKKVTKAKRPDKPADTFKVVAQGGLKVAHLGREVEGDLTQEQFNDLAKIQLNNRPYVTKAD